MIAPLLKYFTVLRAAIGILLILLMGCKIAAPVFLSVKTHIRIAVSPSQASDNDESQKENSSSGEKEKEFTSAFSYQNSAVRWCTPIVHITAYQDNYQTTHSFKVFSPPPDLS